MFGYQFSCSPLQRQSTSLVPRSEEICFNFVFQKTPFNMCYELYSLMASISSRLFSFEKMILMASSLDD